MLPPIAPAAGTSAGERRYANGNVLRLVGSTSISAGLDAEEWRDSSALSGSRLGGGDGNGRSRRQEIGRRTDGVVRLSGSARERCRTCRKRGALDPAAHCGNSIGRMPELARPEARARIGIETGPAVVDAAARFMATSPNIAARVQALAETGAVLVTARVQRQVAQWFIPRTASMH